MRRGTAAEITAAPRSRSGYMDMEDMEDMEQLQCTFGLNISNIPAGLCLKAQTCSE